MEPYRPRRTDPLTDPLKDIAERIRITGIIF
jgi:hypothetical protein